ncbi:hypothetical protein OF83DRAFT_409626 [Amylostereum chailletii]|nr:hypothetical protein OF83DRAFT_409626 [Amylostereum chailletii]
MWWKAATARSRGRGATPRSLDSCWRPPTRACSEEDNRLRSPRGRRARKIGCRASAVLCAGGGMLSTGEGGCGGGGRPVGWEHRSRGYAPLPRPASGATRACSEEDKRWRSPRGPRALNFGACVAGQCAGLGRGGLCVPEEGTVRTAHQRELAHTKAVLALAVRAWVSKKWAFNGVDFCVSSAICGSLGEQVGGFLWGLGQWKWVDEGRESSALSWQLRRTRRTGRRAGTWRMGMDYRK